MSLYCNECGTTHSCTVCPNCHGLPRMTTHPDPKPMTDEQTKAGAVLPWSCYWREGICGPPPGANIVSFNGEDVLPIAYVPNPDDRYAIIHKHNACVKRIWDSMVAASGPNLSDYSRVVQIPGNTLDLAPDGSWAHSDAELAKGVRELASTPQPPPEQAGSVGVPEGVAFDPICGACDKRLSRHHREQYDGVQRIYCNTTTTGDVFTDEPRDAAILEMLAERMPDTHNALVAAWKREHGHAAPAPKETP